MRYMYTFLNLSYRKYGRYTTTCWVDTLWKEVSCLPIHINHRKPVKLPLSRVNDEYIMKIMVDLQVFNIPQLRSINRVRMHHKCYALSHITTGDGKSFKTLSKHFTHDQYELHNYQVQRPTKADYGIWENALTYIPISSAQYSLG